VVTTDGATIPASCFPTDPKPVLTTTKIEG